MMPLADLKGRTISYLRLSVTDRCNYRCTYCLPAGGFERVERAETLRIEELARIARIFASLGVDTVRITGGEPTVRRGLVDLVEQLSSTEGIDDIAMTTNGHLLSELAVPLREAGLGRLNISIDSLDPATHRQLTRGAELDRVVAGIEAARDAGFTAIKTNTVVIGGLNDHEAADICHFAWAHGATPRFIELMPLGEAGRQYGRKAVVPTGVLRARLGDLLEDEPAPEGGLPGQGPAFYHRRRGHPDQRVGFIGAVTEKFCSACNRLRVTCQGELRGCLARPEGADLRAALRDGASDDALQALIRRTVLGREDGHVFWEDGADESSDRVVMTGVGG